MHGKYEDPVECGSPEGPTDAGTWFFESGSTSRKVAEEGVSEFLPSSISVFNTRVVISCYSYTRCW